MTGMKNLVYKLLIVSVIAFAFFAILSTLVHISYATGTANTIVTANVVVPLSCFIGANVGSINFGSAGGAYVAPGTTSNWNSILYNDNAGNINVYLYTASTNWIYTSNSNFGFGAPNTLWSPTASGGTAMTLWPTTTNTNILLPLAGTNVIYYAVSVPNAQPAATYTSNIIGQVTC